MFMPDNLNQYHTGLRSCAEILSTPDFYGNAAPLTLAEVDIALELNPNLLKALSLKGTLLIFNGQADLALDSFRKALAQSPRDPFRWAWLAWLSCACIAMGRFEEAIPWAEKAAALSPMIFSRAYLAIAYARIGAMDQALAAKSELLKVQPAFNISFMRNAIPSLNPVLLRQLEDNFYTSLRMVGIPD